MYGTQEAQDGVAAGQDRPKTIGRTIFEARMSLGHIEFQRAMRLFERIIKEVVRLMRQEFGVHFCKYLPSPLCMLTYSDILERICGLCSAVSPDGHLPQHNAVQDTHPEERGEVCCKVSRGTRYPWQVTVSLLPNNIEMMKTSLIKLGQSPRLGELVFVSCFWGPRYSTHQMPCSARSFLTQKFQVKRMGERN